MVPSKQLPNALTVARMFMAPIFLGLLLAESYTAAAILFALAALTDHLDGRLARKYQLISTFGKLVDPVADKVLTTAALLGFMQLGLCNVWVLMLVLTREFMVTSVRLVATARGVVIAANAWGKAKTVSQMAAVLVILILAQCATQGWLTLSLLHIVSGTLLWITVGLTWVSGASYLRGARKILQD